MRRRTERAVGVIAAVLGGTFVIAALAFATGGFATSAVHMAPGSILGAVAGLALLIAAAGLFAHRRWGWGMDIAGHVLGIGAALLAMFGIAAQRDAVADSGGVVSGAMLVLLLVSLFTLWRARPRRPLRRVGHEMAAKLY
ncbi:MAG TPA: hypothetical protein VFN67_33285 [Polyangiales bacterium]|nr:hypothetical protein [Polyangiales bacterium]